MGGGGGGSSTTTTEPWGPIADLLTGTPDTHTGSQGSYEPGTPGHWQEVGGGEANEQVWVPATQGEYIPGVQGESIPGEGGVIPLLQDYINQQPMEVFDGPTVAQFNPNQQAAQQQILNQVSGLNNLAGSGIQTQQGLIQAGGQGSATAQNLAAQGMGTLANQAGGNTATQYNGVGFGGANAYGGAGYGGQSFGGDSFGAAAQTGAVNAGGAAPNAGQLAGGGTAGLMGIDSVNNPYMNDAVTAAQRSTLQGFEDMLGGATDTLLQKVMPGIRSSAIGTGALGGSRQGLQEEGALGIFGDQISQALSRGLTNIGDIASTMYGSSAENQANRALSAYGTMAGLGVNSQDLASNRGLQSGLAAQNLNMGAAMQGQALTNQSAMNALNASNQSAMNAQGLTAQSAMQAQGLTAQSALAQQQRALTSGLQAQNLSATSDLAAQQRALQAGLGQLAGGNTMQSTANQALATAGGMVPMLQNSSMMGANAQMQVGAQQMAMEQANIDAEMQAFLRQQNAPLQAIGNIVNTISPLMGAGSTTINTGAMPGMSAGQGAMSGAMMGTSIMPGWGTAIGAGAGALGLLG